MDQKGIKYYFLGIGGIGMSSLAKYLFDKGFNVMGYDKTPSNNTSKLIQSGISILFDDQIIGSINGLFVLVVEPWTRCKSCNEIFKSSTKYQTKYLSYRRKN